MSRVLSIDREDSKRDLFGYNLGGELTSANYGLVNNVNPTRTATYTLDPVGNRTLVVDAGVSKTYVPDILNRYTSVGALPSPTARRIRSASIRRIVISTWVISTWPP